MKKKEKAQLKDGRIIEYIAVDDPPAGGMKKTYFAPDKSYVVQFFHNQSTGNDPNRIARLEAILGKYNPTITEDQGGAKGGSQASADYFKKLFCWPTAIVTSPQIGIVAPAYSNNYFFSDGPWKGGEKIGRWFVGRTPSGKHFRDMMPDSERGAWINYFKLCILMARAVRRLHQAGLAHSDLSCNNILIDPAKGLSVVIDIDSLVVPQLFPPDVLGTPGYIAPEVLGTVHLTVQDPKRIHPSARTDQHALAVLIYEYLLFRHPLKGPKTYAAQSGEEQERLEMGSKALFIEHPSDKSNRPKNLKVGVNSLGPVMSDLFQRAFIKGLHAPNDRPSAYEWEKGLIKTWDMLFPCPNVSCSHKWFVLFDTTMIACPLCGTKPKETIPILKLRTERRPGQWMQDAQIVIYHNFTIFKWHAFDNIYPGEEADRTPQAYCVFHLGKWLLINQALTSLTSPAGNRVPSGQAVELKDGTQIRLSQEQHGRIAEVQILKV